jgi:hypothetical protein
MFLGSKARLMHRADNLPANVSRLSRHCGILNISQPYRPPWPVTGRALFFTFFKNESAYGSLAMSLGPTDLPLLTHSST